jgi:hypothetical protein
MVIIGIDPAKPGDDHSVMVVHGGRQVGKSAMVREAVEQMLDQGVTVYIPTTGELRGASIAKDITPKEGS